MTSSDPWWVREIASRNGNSLVWGSLVLAVIVVGARWFCLPGGYRSAKRPLGEVNWSFTDSWASTLTAGGAILGTILATSGIVPDAAAPLSPGALAGLNLLFAFIIVLAPLAFSAAARVRAPLSDDTGDGPRYQGYSGLFMAATVLTVWAVLGELAATAILLRELSAGTLSDSLTWLFLVLLVVSVAAVVLYAWGTIRATVTYEPPADQGIRQGAPEQAPRWNLL